MDKNKAFATTVGIARKYFDKTKLLQAEIAELKEQLAECAAERDDLQARLLALAEMKRELDWME